MNELFRVDSLDEITYDHFEMACIAAMSESEELKGLLGVPCGTDYLLYQGKGKAQITVRNWSHMLSLHITSRSGLWLTCDHIEGMGVNGVIEEAYRRFEVAKPYINKNAERAFKEVELSEGSASRWIEYTEGVMQKIRKYLEETK